MIEIPAAGAEKHHGRALVPAMSVMLQKEGAYFFAGVSVPRSMAAVATAE